MTPRLTRRFTKMAGLLPRSALALVLLATLVILPLVHVHAQDLQPVPPLTARVVDQTATLSGAQQQALDERLRAFEQRRGSQIAVLIVARTAPEAIEQYAIRVAEQWKIGRSKIDDGAILVVAKDERALRIEVGYGLEGALNDVTARRIIDEHIVPRFKAGDVNGGIRAGTDAMMRVIDGEPLPGPAGESVAEDNPLAMLPLLLFAALMVGGVLRAILGHGKGALATGALVGIATWLLSGALLLGMLAAFIGLVITLGGGRMGGGWRGGRHTPVGGWGGGFGGGGGFRGGGGGFGGGGASGRW